MTVDGTMTITAYKDDSFGLTTTFYNNREESLEAIKAYCLAHKTCIGARFRVVEMRKVTTNDRVLVRPIFELI